MMVIFSIITHTTMNDSFNFLYIIINITIVFSICHDSTLKLYNMVELFSIFGPIADHELVMFTIQFKVELQVSNLPCCRGIIF